MDRIGYHKHNGKYIQMTEQEKQQWNNNKPIGIHEKNYDFEINKPVTFKFL